jgi:hypothetical protein
MASTTTSPIMVFVHHFTYIPCKTCWDTKLVELISLNKSLYMHYFKFPHYLQWLTAKMPYNGRQQPPTLRSLLVPSKGYDKKYWAEQELR